MGMRGEGEIVERELKKVFHGEREKEGFGWGRREVKNVLTLAKKF